MDKTLCCPQRYIAACVLLIISLGMSDTALADKDDLITTASTAGTTAYIVGKNIDDDDFAQAHEFADSQAVALRREAACGGGENIDSLATLLGEDPQTLGQWMQTHYAALYGNKPRTQDNIVDRIVAMR